MSIGTQEALKSIVTDMDLTGFVRDRMEGHVRTWALDAMEKNPGVIGSLLHARKGGNPYNSPFGIGVKGYVFDHNEYAGKYLTGLAYLYAASPREDILRVGSELVNALEEAQCPDGYLGVHGEGDRLGGTYGNWDVWGHYHVGYGLIQWYKITGNAKALSMAAAAADCCIRYFSDRSYAVGSEFTNYSICHLYALLYQETNEEKYLKEALRVVEQEWPKHGDWMNQALAGKDFWEIEAKEKNMARWEALHSILALSTLYQITGEPRYGQAFEQIWRSLLSGDRHNTGGFSSGERAVGNPYAEGAIETCCCVAWLALCLDYLRLSRDSRVADEMELTYFNTLLGSLTQGLREITYDTPMNGTKIPTQVSLSQFFCKSTPDFNCCQANSCRAIGEVSQWAAMSGSEGIYLNYYAPCTLHIRTLGGQAVSLEISGNYPVNGNVTITLKELKEPERFCLFLRIPCWAVSSTVEAADGTQRKVHAGSYEPMDRTWKEGDSIRLTLDMTTHYWKGEGRFEGKASVYYGPILLALDSHYEKTGAEDTELDGSRMMRLSPQDGADQGCWLKANLPATNGKSVTLVDFASAGIGKTAYTTWLNVHLPDNLFLHDKKEMPIWCRGIQFMDL